MVGEVIYRIAKIEDAPELKLLNDLFNGENSNSVGNIKEGIARNDAETVFVAETDEKLIGFCCGQLLRSICYSVFYVEITEIFIDEAFQHKGIGKGLLHFAEEWYRGNNIHDFQLFTGLNNVKAQLFYERNNYHKENDILYRKRDVGFLKQTSN